MKAQDLKKSILQYAMEGKLIAQDPTDEPASELLKRIKAEKERLIKEGKIKKEKPLPPITKDEIPYELPQGWEWVRLGDVVNYGSTGTVDNNNKLDENTWILDLEDIEKESSKLLVKNTIKHKSFNSSKKIFKKGDVLYGKLRPYLDKVIVAEEDGICTTEILPLRIYYGIDSYYLKWFLKSPMFIQYVNQLTYGVKMPRLGTEDGKNALLALPPLAEQKRIVEKLDEILPLVEEYGRNEEILSEMNKKLPKQIRQSILQYAVQGKLVEQNPQDEPASELLKRIKAEKEQLIKEGKIKKAPPLPPITQDEIPYELPQGWEWARLGDIIKISSGNFLPAEKMNQSGNIPVYGGNGISGYHNEYIVDKPTLIIGRVGFYCGCVHLSKGKAWVTDNAFITRFSEKNLDIRFLRWLLISSDLGKNDNATAQPVVSGKKIYPLVVPIPPLAEQKRIVAKVDELMKYADKLAEIPSNIIKIRESKDTEINSKNNKVDITKAINKRAILNAKIVEKFNNNNIFSAISDEKLIFITEKVLELPLEGKYKKAVAGSLDKKARNEVKKIFKELNWFDVIEGDSGQKEQYIPLDNLCEYNDLYNKCFSNKRQEIDRVLNLFTGQNLSKAEPVATLYAVWNNLLIDNKECSDEIIIKGFYEWSNRKARYNKNDLLDLLVWMRYHNLIPEGKGEKITV